MIGKVIRGWDGANLVRYLMSQGEHNEHTRPTVIAAWQGDPDALQPKRIGPGDFDYGPGEVGALAREVVAVAAIAGLPTSPPERGEPGYAKQGYVWHCPVSIEAEAGQLDHATWRAIAEDVMSETGIAAGTDAGACRWIAVHHGASVEGNDHIHIAAILLREDTGRRFEPYRDFVAVRRVMRRWEDRLATRRTNGKAAAPSPTRGETEKARRRLTEHGDEGFRRAEPAVAARVQLRQVITETAALASSEDDMVERLHDMGVRTSFRRDDGGKVVGWAVSAPGDVARTTGQPIFFAVGKHISPDLSWPRLAQRWHMPQTNDPRSPVEVLRGAAANARSARDAVRADPRCAPEVATVARDMLAVWAALAEGAERRGALSHAEWTFDTAVRSTPPSPPVASVLAQAMRETTREMASLRLLTGRGAQQRDAAAELALALIELLLELSAWHAEAGRATSGRACGSAADHLRQQFGSATRPLPSERAAPPARAPKREQEYRAPSTVHSPDHNPRKDRER